MGLYVPLRFGTVVRNPAMQLPAVGRQLRLPLDITLPFLQHGTPLCLSLPSILTHILKHFPNANAYTRPTFPPLIGRGDRGTPPTVWLVVWSVGVFAKVSKERLCEIFGLETMIKFAGNAFHVPSAAAACMASLVACGGGITYGASGRASPGPCQDLRGSLAFGVVGSK